MQPNYEASKKNKGVGEKLGYGALALAAAAYVFPDEFRSLATRAFPSRHSPELTALRIGDMRTEMVSCCNGNFSAEFHLLPNSELSIQAATNVIFSMNLVASQAPFSSLLKSNEFHLVCVDYPGLFRQQIQSDSQFEGHHSRAHKTIAEQLGDPASSGSFGVLTENMTEASHSNLMTQFVSREVWEDRALLSSMLYYQLSVLKSVVERRGSDDDRRNYIAKHHTLKFIAEQKTNLPSLNWGRTEEVLLEK